MGNVRTGQVIKLDYRKAAVMLMSGFIAVLFFKNSEAASRFVSRGIEVSVTRLIPSLFPFLVVSSLLLSSGLGRLIGKTAGKPLCALLGISGEGACAVLLGFICGFPVGAKCAYSLLGEGKIEKRECERLLAICSIPSPAFVIGVIGEDVLGSRSDGVWLWLICGASVLCVGIFLRLVSPLPTTPTADSTVCVARKNFSTLFTSSVREGAESMLYVCAFVIFFSAFLGALDAVISPFSLPRTARALLFGFFELTSGSLEISALEEGSRFAICALTAGWSGLSVHFQTMAICSGERPSFKPFILSHAARAVIGYLVALLLGGLLFF